MSRKKGRRRRGITPWKKTALKVCVFWLVLAGGIHLFRIWKSSGFYDQMEASRWGSEIKSAQVSAFLPQNSALKEESIGELEYQINTTLAQDSIKLTSDSPNARLWLDCYSGTGNMTITAGKKTVNVEAVGTGGAFFTFHPLLLSAGSYYQTDSLMKDEILLDRETAWKLFGAFNVIGRTVQVQDAHLRIAGVYNKEEGTLYDKAGLSEYLVFVQYRTLVKYAETGAGTGTEESGTSGAESAAGQAPLGRVPNTASIPGKSAAPAFGIASEGADEEIDISNDNAEKEAAEDRAEQSDTAQEDAAQGTAQDQSTSGGAADSGAAQTDQTGGTSGTGETGSSSGNGEESGTTSGGSQNSENVGNANTSYKDTGRITTYEIVMPDPVEGYAAAVLDKALGEDSGAVVVDNTNRYRFRWLLQAIKDFPLLGIRTESVRYPYWENAAIGWQTIFAELLVLEGLLILMTVCLLLLMLIHWYRHKPWTLLSTYRHLQDSIYERQSRKRYPEYYRERDKADENSPGEGGIRDQAAPAAAEPRGGTEKDGIRKEPGTALLEEKEQIPFERIPENRKAVLHETIQEDDQLADSGGSGADSGGLRWWRKQ